MISVVLLDHLWQSTVVAALAGLVTLALRRNRASLRYGIWLAASAKFFVPFHSIATLYDRLGLVPAAIGRSEPYAMVLDTVSAPFVQPAVTVAAAPHAARLFPELIGGLWLAGVVGLLAAWIVRWRRVSAVVAAATPVTHGPMVDSLRRLEQVAGVTRPIRIVASGGSLEPGVFGLSAPTLVWPVRIESCLDGRQRDAIVAHEVAHVRRRDNLAAAWHMCVQTVFWFHPLVWWIGARLIDERERACDEDVISLLGHDRSAYAEGILKTCRFSLQSSLPCVAGVTGSDLRKRIARIMAPDVVDHLCPWKKVLLAVSIGSVLALPVLIRAQSSGTASAVAQSDEGAVFDVASVKPDNAIDGRRSAAVSPSGSVRFTYISLRDLLWVAYATSDIQGREQIVGGPSWVATDRFDIAATDRSLADAQAHGRPIRQRLDAMLRTLINDRFHARVHLETRESPVYLLAFVNRDGTLGPAIHPSTHDCPAEPGCGVRNQGGRVTATGVLLEDVGRAFTNFAMVDGPVRNGTGLTGRFDFSLQYTPAPPAATEQSDVAPSADFVGSFLAAMQDQLGLKLQREKGQVPFVVVDHVEKPTPD